jgi:protein phosphatase
LTAEAAANHQLRHVITNCVGGGAPGVRTEVHTLEVQAGDVLLLCTDGLTEMLGDEAIASVLASNPEPRFDCEELVRLANAAGGRDNVTVVVAKHE